MENTVNNTTAATENNAQTAQAPRQREHGNFRGQRVMRDLNELDPKQFPSAQKPREDRVPVWAQQLQKSVDLLSQEQQKMCNYIDAILHIYQKPAAYDDTKLLSSLVELKKQIEAHDAKIRDNQRHAHDTMMSGLKDLMMSMNDFLAKQESQKATRGFFWYILNPKTALKEWWQHKTAERRQRRAEKLEAKLKALRASK